MAKEYPGLINIDASVLTVAQRTKLATPILARMAQEGVYNPGTDEDPSAAAQVDFVEEVLERALLSMVAGYYKRARIDAAQQDDPSDNL